ncbi:MAG TPA: GNAT family N-acetyltransferase [Acidimicrobiia bacterium]
MSQVGVALRPAKVDEAPALSELALRSKAHWGYDEAFLEACRDELTVRPEHVAGGRVVVATSGARVVGFSILLGGPPRAELEMLFVEPDAIGTRVGSVLLARLRADSLALGCRALRIEADPHAVGFYEHHGAVRVGDEPSATFPGRTLPILELDLRPA